MNSFKIHPFLVNDHILHPSEMPGPEYLLDDEGKLPVGNLLEDIFAPSINTSTTSLDFS
jgi:hypothetical protein